MSLLTINPITAILDLLIPQPAVIGNATNTVVTEDVNVSSAGLLTASGSISISDPNYCQAFFKTTVTSASGNLGTLTMGANGTYTYSVADSAVQYLGAGQTRVDTFTVASFDGTTKQVSFTINGANDAAVIGNATVTSVTEDTAVSSAGLLTATGSISISDTDAGQASFQTTVVSANGNLGSLTLAANGTYTYAVADSAAQYLGAGQSKVDTFTITSFDGTTKQMSFTIKGANDAAVIGTPTVASVTEDVAVSAGLLTATGSISISDADAGQASFQTTVTSAGGNLGSLTLAANGTYTYSVADSVAQYLGAGQTKVDTFTVTSFDGTTKQVSFTINGVNDAAVIGNPSVAGVTENAAVSPTGMLTATGSISISDADAGQASFHTAVTSAAGDLGTLTLAANGTYMYSVANSAVQSLGAGQTKVDTFTVTSLDGTSQQESFTIHGVNHVPVITTADRADIAVVLPSLAQVSINNGDGSFQPFATAFGTTGSSGLAVALGDVNGDGKLDLIAVDRANGAYVGLGNGDGTFKAATAVATGGSGHYAVALADVNGDGKLDIVTSDLNNGFEVSLGNGDGTFQPSQTFATGGSSHLSVALGDVNGDGKIDVVVSDANGAVVSLGNGNGTFQAPTAVTTGGSNHYNVALADLNGDGRLDIIVSDANGADVSLGNGDGTFQASKAVAIAGYSPVGIAVGDVNGDGIPDLVMTDLNVGSGAEVALGNGDGTFQTAKAVATGGSGHYNVALADVNGDGYLDIVVSDNNGVDVSLGHGDGTFSAGFTVATIGNGPYSVALGDINSLNAVTEDAAASAIHGKLNIADPDAGQSSFQAQASTNGTYGAFALNADGSWTYQLDNSRAATQGLAAGQSATEHFTATSFDGSATKAIDVTVEGSNDPVSITSGPQTGTVLAAAPGAPHASGVIAFTDPDLTDSHTATIVGGPATGTALGTLSIGPVSESATTAAGSFNWSYSLDPTKAPTGTQSVTESYSVQIDDGHGSTATTTVQIAIDGPNVFQVINGGTGNTALTGTAGADMFKFNSVPTGSDTITGFTAGQDKIGISAAGFGHGLAPGADPAFVTAADHTGVQAAGSNGYFIFQPDASGGALYWDAGGSGTNAIAIAHVDTTHLLHSDLLILV